MAKIASDGAISVENIRYHTKIMSMRCPNCGFDSPDGSSWCDFCKEPFNKKPKTPSPSVAPKPDPLAEFTPEQIISMPAERLLKADAPALPHAPSWLRPLAWAFLLILLVIGGLALHLLYTRYQEKQRTGPPPFGTVGKP